MRMCLRTPALRYDCFASAFCRKLGFHRAFCARIAWLFADGLLIWGARRRAAIEQTNLKGTKKARANRVKLEGLSKAPTSSDYLMSE